MTLFADLDHWHLLNNPVISVTGPKGGLVEVNPFKSPNSPPHPLLRPDAQGIFRPRPRPGRGALQMVSPNVSLAATQVASQQENAQMQPPLASALQPLRIPISQHSQGINGATRVAISMPHVDAQNQTEVITTPALPNGVAPLPPSEPAPKPTDNDIPIRLISQAGIAQSAQSQIRPDASTNGYHFPSPNAAPILANSTRHPNGLSPQQMQHLHTIFSSMPPHEFAALQAGYGIPVSYNMNLKPPSAARQMQWISSMQRSPSNVDGQASPNATQGLPMRSTSATSTPPGTRN
jgi:enhancer of polycomb-like protein